MKAISFRKTVFIEVFCARCGVRYNDDDSYEKVFQDKEEAIEEITDNGWTVRGNKAFCEDCMYRLKTTLRLI